MQNLKKQNIEKLKEDIIRYFSYMFENKAKKEIENYDYDSFLDFSSFYDNFKTSFRFRGDFCVADFNEDKVYQAYAQAIDDLLNQ